MAKRIPAPTRRPPVSPRQSRKHQYSVIIEPCEPGCLAYDEGARYFFNFNKHYGDVESYGGPATTIEECLAKYPRMKATWEGFDGILDRMGDPVNERTLYFEDRTGSGLTIQDLLALGEPRKENEPVTTKTQTASSKTTTWVGVDRIDPNPYQPRQQIIATDVRELADSIKSIGLLQNPVARPVDSGKRFQLAVGHQRFEAIKLLMSEGEWGETVPVELRDLTDLEMAVAALEENRKRKSLRPIDEIRAYRKALDGIEGLGVTELARRIGIDHSHLSNQLAVLNLPPFVLDLVDDGLMSVHAAREFLALHNTEGKPNPQKAMMQHVIEQINKTGGYRTGSKPDFSVKAVRYWIYEAVKYAGQGAGSHFGVSGQPDRKVQWRPIDPVSGSYSSGNDRPDWPHDTAAFAKEYPDTIYRIPLESGEGSRRWTCDAVKWQTWRDRAAAKARQEREGTPPGPKPTSAAAKEREQAAAAVESHPLVKAKLNEERRTSAAAVTEIIKAIPEPKPHVQEITQAGKGTVMTIEPNAQALAHIELQAQVRDYLQKGGANRKRFDEIMQAATRGTLPAEITGGTELGEKGAVKAVLNYLKDIGKEIDKAAAADTGSKAALTDEQRKNLGTLGEPVLKYKSYGQSRLAAILTGSKKSLPSWFDDPKECTERCVIGARFAHEEYSSEKAPHLVCTNNQHFAEKMAASKAKVEKRLVPVIDAENKRREDLVAQVLPLMPGVPGTARVLAAFAVRGAGRGLDYTLPEQKYGYAAFQYAAANVKRLAEITNLSLDPPNEHRTGEHIYGMPKGIGSEALMRDDLYNRILDVGADVARETLTRVLVAVAEERFGFVDGLNGLAESLGLAEAPAKGAASSPPSSTSAGR